MPITYEGIVAKSNALDTRVKFFAQITNMKWKTASLWMWTPKDVPNNRLYSWFYWTVDDFEL